MPRDHQRFLSIQNLAHMPKPKWAIDGLFEENSLSMLAGPPSSMKSFQALSWLLAMASGRKWHDRATIHAKVLYMLGEGKSNLLKRIESWSQHQALTRDERYTLNDHFRTSFEMPQLARKDSVDIMLSQLDAEHYEPTVIVIDTFARSFVGLDENSQQDTGLWVEQADRLRQLGYTVIFLHHTAKNTEFGFKYRGSTAIEGAMDSSFIMHRDGPKLKFFCTKQKDHDEGPPIWFQKLSVRPDGAYEEGSVVLVPAVGPIERSIVDNEALDAAIMSLMLDNTFDSDRARARALVEQFPNLTEAAAQTRVSKARKEVKPKKDEQIH